MTGIDLGLLNALHHSGSCIGYESLMQASELVSSKERRQFLAMLGPLTAFTQTTREIPRVVACAKALLHLGPITLGHEAEPPVPLAIAELCHTLHHHIACGGGGHPGCGTMRPTGA